MMGPRHGEAARLPAPATGLFVGLAAVKVLLHCFHGSAYGYFRDELYYIACSDHLAWGYVDHPPLSIALLAAARALFGDSLFAIRLLVVLAGAASVVLTGLLAREFGGGRAAQGLAALAYLVTGWCLAFGSLYSMNSFDALLWIVAMMAVARLLRDGDQRWWLVFGLVCGIGLLNKYSIGFLAFGVVAGMLLTPARRLLLSRWLVLGGALAALLFAPHVIWEIANGLPTLEFMRNAAAYKITQMPPLAYVGALATEGNPFTAPIWLLGLVALLAAPALRPFRALGVAFVCMLLLFLVQTAKPYYLSPAIPMLFAAGAITIERWAQRRGAWVTAVATAWLVVGGAAAVPATLPLLPPPALVRYLHAIGVEAPREERGAPPELPQILADRIGWEHLVRTVAQVYGSLPEDERAGAAILGSNYGEAGAVDFFGPALGLPPAISGHNNYWLWGLHGYRGGTMVTIGAAREQLEQVFGRVDLAATVIAPPHAHPLETNLPIFVCRDLKLPLDDAWQAVKRFI